MLNVTLKTIELQSSQSSLSLSGALTSRKCCHCASAAARQKRSRHNVVNELCCASCKLRVLGIDERTHLSKASRERRQAERGGGKQCRLTTAEIDCQS